MGKTVRRGFSQNDDKEFGSSSVKKLQKAGGNLEYLLNEDYNIKGASVFVSNHYMLSERQRLALVRAVSSQKNIDFRKQKEIKDIPEGSVVNIDGFNIIITLEVALSDSVLLKCMDGTIRDLAELRGTYRLIDKTQPAIMMLGKMMEESKIGKAVFYLDAPVSNCGRLKEQILELLAGFSFEVQVEIVDNADVVLHTLDNVVTSDAIILDKCKSWININSKVIKEYIGEYPYVDFSIL